MMIAFIGQACLGGALLLATLQTVGLRPLSLLNPLRLAYGQVIFVTLAFLFLLYAHVFDQFSLLTVALHSHTQKPLLYKISGVWGHHEGSMLLWILILTLFGALVIRHIKNLEFPYSLAIPVFGFINFCFYLFLLMACDPFALVDPIPTEGQDLNPLLQDPSLAVHPPLLYIGYAGSSVPFVFAVMVLIAGKIPKTWASTLRPWAIFCWTFLTVGVALGSFWAYYELGWGGWWFWDPVENAALMPWLSATALIHTIRSLDTTKSLQSWTLFLSILTFALCLLGTFLVRSGLLVSVHNFAVDAERGAFILILSSFLILPAFGLFFWRLKELRSQIPTIPLSRSGFILLMTLILMVGTFTVALGTLYPLILEAFGQKITVGSPYFQATFVPMMLPLLALVGLGTWYTWKDLPTTHARWLLSLFCLTLILLFILYAGFGIRHILGLAAFACSVWVILTTLAYAFKKRKIFSGMIFAHLGIGIATLGMIGSSLGEKEVIKAVALGESFSIGPGHLLLENASTYKGKNYNAQQLSFRLTPGDTLLIPEKRFYWTQNIIHSESAIRSFGLGNLSHVYITLGDEYKNHQWSIHAYYKPFINLLWVGALLVALGGVIALIKRFMRQKKLLILGMIFMNTGLAFEAHEQHANPALEARARALSQKILCPVCHGQVLDDSPIELAAILRSQIRNALNEGQTDQEIMNKFIDQYGPQIIISPPYQWNTFTLWWGPWFIFILIISSYIAKNYLHINFPRKKKN